MEELIILDKFAERFSYLVSNSSIDVTTIAQKIGIKSKSTIYRYINGEMTPKISTVKYIAEIFNVNPAWLMGVDVPMECQNAQSNTNAHCIKDDIISIPVVGKITAGQPILASEYVEHYFPIAPEVYGINNPNEYFYLIVRGDSMNRRVQDGDYVLIHKQDYAQDGDIVVAIVNGDNEATLKKFEQINEQFVRLLPMSTNPIHNVLTIDLKETEFKIIGKAIGNFGRF